MKNKYKRQNNEKGVALILTLGILTLLLVLGVAFVMNMTLESGGAVQHDFRTKARFVAEGGIERAIMELRAKAKVRSFDSPIIPGDPWESEAWFYDRFKENTGRFGDPSRPSFSNIDGVIGDSFTEGIGTEEIKDLSGNTKITHTGKCILKIRDCSSMININDWNPNLQAMLERLFTKLGVASAATVAQNIINKRDNQFSGKYPTKEHVKLADGVGDGVYNTIKDYITVFSYVDPNVLDNTGVVKARAPVNLNTAPKFVLQAVLEGVEGVGTTQSSVIADRIIEKRPLVYWSGFDYWIDDLGSVSNEIKQRVKQNANPNRKKPDFYSTEFSFSSGGFYEIESNGMVYKKVGNTETKMAQKTLIAVARLFKVKTFSKQSDFDGYDDTTTTVTDPNVVAYKTTAADSCPVVSTDDRTQTWSEDAGYSNASNYYVVKNAVKLGFWDNFRNDLDGGQVRFYSKALGWSAGSSTIWKAREGSSIVVDVVDNTLKLSGGYGPVCDLVGNGKNFSDVDDAYKWKEFGLKIQVADINGVGNKAEGPRDVNNGEDPLPVIYDNVTGAVIHWPGTCMVPPEASWQDFWPGTKCVLGQEWNYEANEGTTDYHGPYDGPIPNEVAAFGDQTKKEWPLPKDFVCQVLLNGNNGIEEKVFVAQFVKTGSNPKSGQLMYRNSANEDKFYSAKLVYNPKKDIYVAATGNKYYFWLIDNGTGANWGDSLGDTERSPLSANGSIGLYGKGGNDDRYSALHLTWGKIGYVRIIPGSPGAQYKFNNLGEYNFTDPTLIGGTPQISDFGYWGTCFDVPENVSWGTLSGTITIPKTANANSEGVVFLTSSDGSSWDVSKFRASRKGISEADSKRLYFRALLITQKDQANKSSFYQSGDPTYKYYLDETPVLEDVTITYLPKAEILYSRDVQK
ncbi:MAG TPA: type II secretion system protein GspK [bacterium]|nr:type II secretion system protein GspK [bacterium]